MNEHIKKVYINIFKHHHIKITQYGSTFYMFAYKFYGLQFSFKDGEVVEVCRFQK